MNIKLIPFKMDADTAAVQVGLVRDAIETLADSRESLTRVGEGQTEAVWTADGKSVDLAVALRARYESAVKWLDAIESELNIARENLLKAIDETTDIDEASKQKYRTLLYKAEEPSTTKTVFV